MSPFENTILQLLYKVYVCAGVCVCVPSVCVCNVCAAYVCAGVYVCADVCAAHTFCILPILPCVYTMHLCSFSPPPPPPPPPPRHATKPYIYYNIKIIKRYFGGKRMMGVVLFALGGRDGCTADPPPPPPPPRSCSRGATVYVTPNGSVATSGSY